MKKISNKIVLLLITTMLLSILVGSVSMQPAKAAALPLDPATIPKYQDPLVAVIPTYTPTNVTVNGTTVRQDYYINVTQFTETMLPASMGLTTPVWGYGGRANINGVDIGYFRNSPSATFDVIRNIPTKITWVNNLTDPISGALLNYLYPVDPTFDWANPNMIPVDAAIQQAGAGLAPPFPPGYNGSEINVNGTITNPNLWNVMSPVPISTHVHGAEVYSGSDGGPNQWFTPNGLHGMDYYTYEPTDPNAAVYYYNNTQEPTTLWYHDHAMGLTRINVFSGLAGYYIIRDPADTIAPLLPSGAYDVPLAIQDRAFYDNGSLRFDIDPPPNPDVHPYWVPEYFGDTFMVNGKVWPYFNVNQNTYRFRLLDGCNARFLNLTIVDLDANNATVPFTLIARDGGYLKAPVIMDSTLIGPGMRAEILVNFTGVTTGHRLLLKNLAAAPFPFGASPIVGLTDEVMMFIVQGADATPQYTLPSTLNPGLAGAWPTLPANTATNERLLTLKEVMGMGGPLAVLLDGQHFMQPPSEFPVAGTTENWVIANPTADAHPMHWHLIQFQLVSRQPFDDVGYLAAWEALNGMVGLMGLDHPTLNLGNLSSYFTGPAVPVAPEEQGWLDTVTMLPGQVTTIRIRYLNQDGLPFPFDPTTGPGYVWHCHIVDHEDNDMMRRQLPITPSQLPPLENVIRTNADGIEYRTYNFGTNNWSGLTTLPGTTADSPAAVVENGVLYMVVKGADNSSLYFGSLNLTSQVFSGWNYITGSTPQAPTLATNGTHLALVVKGLDNSIYYRLYDTGAATWGAWVGLTAGSTSDRIAATFIGNSINIVVKAVDNPITMWFNSINVTSGTISGWTWIPGSTPSTPEVVQLTSTNAFKLIVRGSDDTIYMNEWNGQSFQGWTGLTAGSTIAAPAVTIVNDDIYFVVVGSDGITMYFSSMNLLTNSFSGWTALSGTTPSIPELTS